MISLTSSLSFVLSLLSTQTKPIESVGKLPILGYNPWNFYGCSINESIVLGTAKLLHETGFYRAGYNQFNLDDCWSLKERDSITHRLVVDSIKFPRGLKYLSKELNKLGIGMGIYSCNGLQTCHYPGSFGHELIDARDFVDYGCNLLKYDNCHMAPDIISRQNEPGKYTIMRDAIEQVAKETGIKLEYHICEWGVVQPWIWGKQSGGTSWRATTDIAANWESIMSITNIASFLPSYTNFYGRNDFDILEVGNGDLSFEENKSHFTIWALTKSHLLLGTDLARLSPELIKVLTNKNILAINQDKKFGQGLFPFRWTAERNPPYKWGAPPPIFLSDNLHPAPLWSGRTFLGVVVMILNTYSTALAIEFDFVESSDLRAGILYRAEDLYTGEISDPIVRTYSTFLEPHAVAVLLMHEAGNEPDGIGRDCQALDGFNCGLG